VSFVIFLLFISCTLVAICQLKFLYEYMYMVMDMDGLIYFTSEEKSSSPSIIRRLLFHICNR